METETTHSAEVEAIWRDYQTNGPDRRNEREQDRGRCCADPLCPCDRKPGWGPYAATGKAHR